MLEKIDIFRFLGRYKEYAPLVLRLGIAVIFLYHGYGKVFGGIEGFAGFLESKGVPYSWFMGHFVAISEFGGGILLLLGFLTRYVALILTAVMIVALVLIKIPLGFADYEFEMLILVGLISLVFFGAGKISVDSI